MKNTYKTLMGLADDCTRRYVDADGLVRVIPRKELKQKIVVLANALLLEQVEPASNTGKLVHEMTGEVV